MAISIAQALKQGYERIKAATPSARLDAGVLLCFVLGKDRSHLAAHGDDPLPDEAARLYWQLIERRAGHEPVAYLTGSKQFYGLDFIVDQRVLIPRPETEFLVEEAIRIGTGKRNLGVLDLCCGSGCVGLSIAAGLPDSTVLLSDISDGALEVAAANAEALGVKHCKLVRSDLYHSLSGVFDIIASNPPYIPTGDIETLEADVSAHEPRLALDGGKSGLDLLERIIGGAPAFLKANGSLLLEIGHDQSGQVKEMLHASGFENIRVIPDYSGVERIAAAEWPK